MPRLLGVPVRVTPRTNSRAFVINLLTAESHELSKTDVEVIANCRRLLPMSTHSKNLVRTSLFSEAGNRGLATRIRELNSMGLLLSSAEIVELLQCDRHPQEASRGGALAITTTESSTTLQRAIDSITFDHDAPESVVVALDGEETRKVRRDLAERKRGSQADALSLMGRLERRRVVQEIAGCLGFSSATQKAFDFGVDSSTLFRPTTGANRNGATLVTAGLHLVTMDDDIIGRGDDPSEATSTIVVTGKSTKVSFRVIGSEEFSLADKSSLPINLWGRSRNVIGRRPAAIVGNAARVQLDCLHSDDLYRLLGFNARVTLSSFGLVGDGAFQFPHFMLFDSEQQGDHRSSANRYEFVRKGRWLVRGGEEKTLTTSDHWMSYCGAIDNGVVNPPVFPFGRGDDEMFGLMQGMLKQGDLRYWDPARVLHVPEPPRAPDPSALHSSRLFVCDLVWLYLRGVARAPENATRGQAISSIGDQLRNRSQCSLRRFAQEMREFWYAYRGHQVAALNQLLSEGANFCDEWHRDVDALIANLEAELASETITPPIEYRRAGFTTEAAFLPEFQRHLQLYGELVYHWPEIWEAARELREAGKLDFSVI